MKNRDSKNKNKRAEKAVRVVGQKPFHLVGQYKRIRIKTRKINQKEDK